MGLGKLIVDASGNLRKPTVLVGSGMITYAKVEENSIPDKPAMGALAALEPEYSPFKFDRLTYPITGLGEGQKYPHYITFYINIRDQSKYKLEQKVNTTNRESELQKNSRKSPSYNNATLPIVGDTINFKRKTTRTTQAIHLYMPDSVHWAYRNHYRDVGLTDALPFTKIGELGGDVVDAVKKGIKDGSNISTIVGNIIKKSGPLATEQLAPLFGIERDLALSSLGYAVNPNIDVIYGAPELRTFIFDFVFAPRSSKEANMVRAIIRALKFHAAPESSPDSSFGRYWIPPTEFDIEFSVDSMGKISTCVLESIDVDYAPNGWAAYAEEESRKDMPTNIRMQLQFRELEFITKERISEGY